MLDSHVWIMPDSQVWMCALLSVLVLQIAYFGDGRKALSFFEELDLICEPHYNPADFIRE